MVGPRPRIPRTGPEPADDTPRELRGGRSRDARRNPPRDTQRSAKRDSLRDTPSQDSAGGSSTLAAPTPAHSFNGRLVALIVVATLIVFLAAPTTKIFFDQRAQISALQQSIAREQERQQQLKHEEQLWADDSYVEQQARERMSYVMPGENAYLVIGAQPGVRQSVESSAEQVEASKPAWADGLWQSVVDSAYPPEQITLEPQTRGSDNQ
ncbi:FtsB family cell division protein [Kocuria marina]|uniref:FtsB family cell division protein n=1 Tax=Kocuria marina TaxID=223184 RepID=UPI00345FD837